MGSPLAIGQTIADALGGVTPTIISSDDPGAVGHLLNIADLGDKHDLSTVSLNGELKPAILPMAGDFNCCALNANAFMIRPQMAPQPDVTLHSAPSPRLGE